MTFIDPKTSFAFQRIFGAAEHCEIPRSLFNALLSAQSPPITTLEFFPPAVQARTFGSRDSTTIVRAHYEDHGMAILDAQMISLPILGKRLLLEAAKTYCAQLNYSLHQPEILPLVVLAILDFELLGGETEPISCFRLWEPEQQVAFPDGELSLVCVELPKFTKSLEELASLTDCWLYFLRHAPELEEIPPPLAAVAEIQQAFALADERHLGREELDLLQRQLLSLADQRQSVDVGLSQGLRQGIEQGRQVGRQEGIQAGIEQGRQVGREEGRQDGVREGLAQGKQAGIRQGRLEGLQAGQLSIVRRLLSRRFGTIEAAIATQIEKLSATQLESLAESAWDFITVDDLSEWLDKQA